MQETSRILESSGQVMTGCLVYAPGPHCSQALPNGPEVEPFEFFKLLVIPVMRSHQRPGKPSQALAE